MTARPLREAPIVAGAFALTLAIAPFAMAHHSYAMFDAAFGFAPTARAVRFHE